MRKIFYAALCILALIAVVSCATTKNAPQTHDEIVHQQSTQHEQPALSTAKNEEYLRSVNNVDVTLKTFNEDKTEIMKIIGELADIMSKSQYEAWVKYIDKESIQYWSNPANLRRASRMLPIKNLQMSSLRDYFTYVFVPSRKGRKVDEIRYDSKTEVKAVQMREDTDVIYYYFNKINGKWLVHIPPID
ncbi:MAG: hypothetical protein IJR50_03940 [Treponema sp.]|nr:hypothetical protein [Treponema sp.]